jgi:hypothetical protein
VGEIKDLRPPAPDSLRARYTALLAVAVLISVSGFGFLGIRELHRVHRVHHVHRGPSSPATGTPTASDRATCAELQNAVDDLRAKAGMDAVQAHMSHAGDAANQCGDPALAASVRTARIALGAYRSNGVTTPSAWTPVVDAMTNAYAACARLGIVIKF